MLWISLFQLNSYIIPCISYDILYSRYLQSFASSVHILHARYNVTYCLHDSVINDQSINRLIYQSAKQSIVHLVHQLYFKPSLILLRLFMIQYIPIRLNSSHLCSLFIFLLGNHSTTSPSRTVFLYDKCPGKLSALGSI